MSGHTPGPWTKNGTQIRKGDFYLASSRQSGLPPQEAAANARLIAASPELLAALEELVTWLENWMPVEAEESGGCEATKTCKAAIAKAKGKS